MFHRKQKYCQEVKKALIKRDKKRCVIDGCSNKENLEIHRITNEINGKSILGKELENLEWLVTLCQECCTDQHFVPRSPFNPKSPNKMNINQYKESIK